MVVLGLLAWVAAAAFAVFPFLNTVKAEAPAANGGRVEVQAVSPAAAGASCGFAIAGGLCMLGAALANRNGK
jgi:hypothetical protein